MAPGCHAFRAAPPFYENPTLAPPVDHDLLWDNVVDVVDDYFQIDTEQRIRRVGDTYVMGRLETFPEVGATLLEPWRRDSVGKYERLESTLQSIRRKAIVQVVPVGEGFLVDVTVFKELEDVERPEHATAGGATFRYDDSILRFDEPVGGQPTNVGWIPQGRDTMLEQRILAELQERFECMTSGGKGRWPAFLSRSSGRATR